MILFKNELENYDNLFSESTAGFEVYGNIMSLIYGDDFIGKTEISPSAFIALFDYCTGLTSAENLILPATTLASGCYNYMFWGCTSLVTAPELPATTLANGCYSDMFNGCTSLVTAPELPATTLASGCYGFMFGNCTSLVTAPELPATTLATGCYEGMFRGCSKINYIKCLAENNIETRELTNWLYNVSSSGTFVKAAGVTWPTGTSGIPSGWTVQEV